MKKITQELRKLNDNYNKLKVAINILACNNRDVDIDCLYLKAKTLLYREIRVDRVFLPKVSKTKEGYIKGTAIVTRTGVFKYKNADGSDRFELRHPDDVLNVDSLETLKHIPITNEYPTSLVTAENEIKYKLLAIHLLNFLLAVSTTMGMTIIPILATDTLGLSLMVLGIIEGLTEFIANSLRLISGRLFDKITNRKILFILPPLIAFMAKLTLLLPSALSIFISKTLERMANGMFAAPRDAYVAENSDKKGRAMSFITLSKTQGCIIGSVALSIYSLFIGNVTDNLLSILFISCFISFAAFILSLSMKLSVDKREPRQISQEKNESITISEIASLLRTMKPVLCLCLCFFLARFNDGMLLIYLKNKGLPEWYYVATISFFNIAMLLIAPIAGYLIDADRTKIILTITIISLLLFNVIFSFIHVMPFILATIGLILWGIQRAGAQVTFASIVFKTVSKKSYGLAIGIYSVVSGTGILIASIICGYIAKYSFSYVFLYSGSLSFATLLLTYVYIRKHIK